MSDIVDFITNLEPAGIIGFGLIVCLLTFFLIDKIIARGNLTVKNNEQSGLDDMNKSKEIVQDTDSISNNHKYNNTEECLTKIISEAEVLGRNKIQELLSMASALETNPKSKIRLNVMLKKFLSTNYGIVDIFKMYMPELLTQDDKNLSTENITPSVSNLSHAVLTTNLELNTKDSDIVDTKQPHLSDLADIDKSEKLDQNNIAPKTDPVTNNDFKEHQEPILSLDKQIETLSSSKSLQRGQNEIAVQVPCHDVWANYMCFDNGRMNLKNSFFHLENAWGSVSSIAELQDKISLEISDGNDNDKKEWAMVSVIPFHEPKF